jgi:hypothetical protein
MHDGEPRSAAPLTLIAAAFATASCAAAAHIGADARWLAAVGDAIVNAGSLPCRIAYAAAPSSGWHDAPALGQLVFHALEALLGDRGLVLAQALAVALAVSALSLDLRGSRARDGASALALLAVVVAAPAAFLVVRAELFSLALFPLLVALLRAESRRPSRRIWLAVPLLALWANLHGGVLVGFAVAAAYLVLDRGRARRLESAAVLAAGALALLATPALLHTVDYYAGVLHGEAAAQGYGLWAPLSLHAPLDLVFVAVAAPLLVLAVRGRPRFWELALLVVLAALTVHARRDGIWLVLFAATPAARALGTARPRAAALSRRLAIACCAVPAAIAVLGLTRPVPADAAGAQLLERAAAAAHGTPVLADPVDAEQLALRGTRIWIGNPLDAFPRAQQRLYLDWLRGDGALLHGRIRVVLVERDSEPQKRLAGDASYRELARDERAVLYAAR